MTTSYLVLQRCDHSARRAPVQGDYGRGGYRHLPGTICWCEHQATWLGYSAWLRGAEQSAEKIAKRGGFGYSEILKFLGRVPETYKANSINSNRCADE